LSLGVAYRFFLPLVFMTELNQISKTVIHAVLARTALPAVTLAAFNTAFVLYFMLASATELTVALTISYLKDKRMLRHLLSFLSIVLAIPMLLAQLVAWTPLGDWAYGQMFGLGEDATAQAKLCTFILSITMPMLLGRGVAFGLLMLNKQTALITVCTFVRLLSLGGSLLALPLFLENAALGAAALTICISSESILAMILAWPYYRDLPATGETPPTKRALWRFSWPLILNTSSELGVVFIINLFLGQLINPELALAAFGVVHGLVTFLFSPVRNLAQTAQTLTNGRRDAALLVEFNMHIVAFLCLLAIALFYTPLASVVLDGIMGLKGELRDYCVPALKIAFMIPMFWALSSLFRGMFSKARTTGTLAATGVLRLCAALLIGSITIFFGTANGAVVGLAAWIVSYVVEVGVLAWCLRAIRFDHVNT